MPSNVKCMRGSRERVDPLTTFNLVFSTAMLSVASLMDLLRREVEDWVWLLMASVCGPVTLFRVLLALDSAYPVLVALSVAISSSVAYLFYRLELYGGADAKAVMALSLAYPVNLHGGALHPIAPVSVLLNALIISLVVPLGLLLLNAFRLLVRGEDILSDLSRAPLHVRVAALFLGTRIRYPKRFWAPMLRVEEDGSVRISLSPPFHSYFSDLRGGKEKEVWATPGIPLVVFITAGLLSYLAAGDFLYLLVTSLPGAP